MPDRKRKRPIKANALARWDNEGGAAKGAPQEDREDLISLTREEEHILRRLGAAVITQWNDLPRDVQHGLFDHAISMSKAHHTAKLMSQIARFLHNHKDDGGQFARPSTMNERESVVLARAASTSF
jgi:hypothetical protein